DALVLDAGSAAGVPAPDLPWSPEAGTSRLYRVRVTAGTGLGMWVGETGAIGLSVDGITVTDDGERWQEQDHELRDERWLVHAPGSRREFALPGVVRPGPGQEREVTVQVRPEGVAPGQWQVHVTGAELLAVDTAPVPMTSTDAPEHLAGHRVAA